MSRILIVEDDASVARFLQQALQEAGYHTSSCGNGAESLDLAGGEFDLILLDVMLPGMDGYEVCSRVRERGVTTPILFLTARDHTDDKVRGLDAGGDDYLVKPFPLSELLARVRALLRRRSPNHSPQLRVGDLVLDPAARKARRGSQSITLSSTEYALLELLMKNAGRVLTRSVLLEKVWDYDFAGQDNVLDVYISYLRSKIDKGQAQKLIHTVRGVGYRLEAEA